MGYRIKLDTNGSCPRVVKRLLRKQLVDFVAMDIKTSLEGYARFMKGPFHEEEIMESVNLIMETAPAYEFRTTCVRPFIDTGIMADIGDMIKGASHYILQPCSRNVSVLNPAFFEEQDRFFQDQEMSTLKEAVESQVVCCSVR